MDLTVLYPRRSVREQAAARTEKLKQLFHSKEGGRCDAVFSSSGRAEILGNHTDHNHGKVIVAAIDCDIIAAVGKTDGTVIRICSEGYPDVTVDFSNTAVNKSEYGTSAGLARGVAAGIKAKGYTFGGFTAYTHSTIFKGAGVSSSAAFEVLVCEIINELYLGGALTPMQKAMISQTAENVYFGKPCGLLDQSGIALGGFNMLDFAEPKNPQITALNPPGGYSIVITNTGGDHANLTEHYAAIKSEMHAVAEFFGKKYLREVDKSEFTSHIRALRGGLSGRALLRAYHFYNENLRVEKAAAALESGDSAAFLREVTSSGDSSLNCLQNCFVPGDEVQPIPLALEVTKNINPSGAVRIHGGGFAGTIIAFVEKDNARGYVNTMADIFGEKNVFETDIRRYGTIRVE